MAEIDWDKIIKATRSRHEEDEKRQHLENRLHRMERLLDKLVDEKSREAKDAAMPTQPHQNIQPARREDYRPQIVRPIPAPLAHRGFAPGKKNALSGIGHKVSGILGGRAGGMAAEGLGKIGKPGDKRVISMIGIVAVITMVGAAYFMGVLRMPDFSAVTGLFASKPAEPDLKYVCSDGITTAASLADCPTTTTVETTTTIEATTVATTSVQTTTTSIGPAHSIGMISASCVGQSMTVVVRNTGSASDNIAYLTFFIDGVKDEKIICTPLTMDMGKDATCISGTKALVGNHEIEVRGLINSDSKNVNC